MLHNDKALFERAVLDTFEKYGIVPVIIEKDYYVTLFLREIVKRQPKIIFKGGTSLSKCYHLINRFSEDIDLNMKSCLQEIMDMDIYKKDFESITIPLIFETISYDEVKSSLQKVIDTGLFE